MGDTEFGVQVGIGFLGKIVTAAVGLVGSIIIARIVGPTGYGVFYISVAISEVFKNPVGGWATACKKRLTETQFDDAEALGSLFLVLGLMIVVFGPLSLVGLLAISENQVIPFAVPLLFVGSSMYWSFSVFLSGRRNFSMSVWSETVKTLVETIGKILLVVAGFGVWGMVGGTLFGTLLVVPLLLYFIQVRPRWPSWEAIRSIVSYAKWSVLQSSVGTALSQMDTILLGWLVVASVAGKYQVGLQLTMPAVFVSSVIQSGLMGRVSNLESRGEDWNDDLRNALSYGSVLAIPIFFGSLVIGEELAITVFGGEFSGAGVFVVGLALYRVLHTQTDSFNSVLAGLDRPDIIFWISLVSFVLNVLAGVGLWYVMGAVGIVIATVATAVVTYLLHVYYAHRVGELDVIFTSPFLRQVGAGVAMAAVVWAGKTWVGAGRWFSVAGLVAVGGLTYGVLLVVVSPHLRVTLRGIYDDFRREYI